MWDQIKDALYQATHRVLVGVANFLPALLALVLAVLLSSLVGWLLGALVGVILRALDCDKRLQKWGFVVLAEWSPKSSPTLLLRKTVTWTVVVLGWLVGLTAFGAGVTPQLIVNVVESLPNLGTAIVLVLLGVLLARFLSHARRPDGPEPGRGARHRTGLQGNRQSILGAADTRQRRAARRCVEAPVNGSEPQPVGPRTPCP